MSAKCILHLVEDLLNTPAAEGGLRLMQEGLHLLTSAEAAVTTRTHHQERRRGGNTREKKSPAHFRQN